MKSFKNYFSYLFIVIIWMFLFYGYYEIWKLGYTILFVMLLAMYSLNLFLILFVFLQSRHSQAKLSWIMIMISLPLIGHTLFVIFGQRYKYRQSIKEYQSRKNFQYEIFPKAENEFFTRQSKISNRGVYNANINFWTSGDKIYKELFSDIENAKKFIHIHYFIIKPGEIYDHFKFLLIKKASEGIEIRLIIDDFGRWAMPWYEIKNLIDNGVQVKIFGKIYFPFINSENGFRTHRKLVIIDGEKIHLGGLNIADEYASLNKKFGKWFDLQVRMSGQILRSFSLLFIEDWYQITNEWLEPKKYLLEKKEGKHEVVMVEDSPENKMAVIENTIISMILNAKKSISLSTPYFIPTSKIISALKTAALSGVKIKIFIPGLPDKKAVLYATRFYVFKLRKYGIQFFELKGSFFHSKLGLFDKKISYFGTINLDIRSFYSQFEVIALMSGPKIKQVIKIFNYYEKISNDMNKINFKINFIKKIVAQFYVSLFSAIM